MKRAFTLIELLVVIAIIAILAAILFPVFAQAKAAAKNAASVSNVKQLTTASMLYAGDFDGLNLPYQYQPGPPWTTYIYTGWGAIVQPYTKNAQIAFDAARPVPVPIDNGGAWAWSTTIAVNLTNFASHPDNNWKFEVSSDSLQNVADRAGFITYGDPLTNGADGGYWSGHWFDGQRSACANPNDLANKANLDYNRAYSGGKKYHQDRLIAGFADGHAKSVPMKSVMVNIPADSYGGCEAKHFDPSKAFNTLSDQDQRMQKFWGQWWDHTF